jgi:hypothetical protein
VVHNTVHESLAALREIFRPAIIHLAFAFVLVHNYPSDSTTPSEADRELTKRIAAAAQILKINFLGSRHRWPGFLQFPRSGIVLISANSERLFFPARKAGR